MKRFDPEARPLEASLLDLIAEVDAGGGIVAVSGVVQLLFGWSAEELRGRSLRELLAEEDAARFQSLLERAASRLAPPSCELRFRHRQGWDVWLEVVARPLPDGAGTSIGARDVTIRRQAEMALEESRERYRLLFERSPVGVLHYDRHLRISDCNESFRRIIQSSYERLVGFDMHRLKDQRVLPALEAALAGGQGSYEGPYEATTSMARLWLSLRTVPFHGPRGEVQGGICIVEDVTERKLAEEAQRATYEISEAVHRTDDLRELFTSIHAVLARLMPADNVYIALLDRDTDTVSFPYFVDQHDAPPPPRRATGGLTEAVLRGGEPLLLATRGELERFVASSQVPVHGTLPESWLGVPLRHGQETIGLLALQSYDPLVALGDRHLRMLTFVAGQVAMAIARKRHGEQIQVMAFYDGLTGLYNRRMLQARAQQSIELARRHRWSLTFLYLDLDRFKKVNDTLGHAAGDELLAVSGRAARRAARQRHPGRLGGDEFAFVLHAIDESRPPGWRPPSGILALARSPLRGRRAARPAPRWRVSGWRSARAGETRGAARDADIAMYQAKVEGGSFRFFDPQHSPFSRDRLALEAELRAALAGGEVELHYQPVQALADGALVGFEALARWRRGERLWPAGDFVPLAEESELVRLLDWQLVRRALRETQQQLPVSELEVASNLSARSLHTAGLVEHLATTLAETGVAPGRVVLEVTESAAVSDPAHCSRTLRELAALGVRLALDDFGTGFASLTYLRSMPFHRVKIDGSLIREIGTDARAEELLQGAIGLGHGLGLEVVGEGVESEAQRDWLRAHGCDLVQGHLVGWPVAASELQGSARPLSQP